MQELQITATYNGKQAYFFFSAKDGLTDKVKQDVAIVLEEHLEKLEPTLLS